MKYDLELSGRLLEALREEHKRETEESLTPRTFAAMLREMLVHQLEDRGER